MALYAKAINGRMGLAHGLLAWGRCIVWAKENGAQVIAPNWLQPRLGPYLRRERDKRFYFKLFQAGQQIGGLRGLALTLRTRQISIDNFINCDARRDGEDLIVTFRNLNTGNEARYFHEIYGKSEIVRAALWDMTKPLYRPSPTQKPHIAVHIRGGDFGAASSPEELRSGKHNLRLPIEWYAQMIVAMREILGFEVPVIVYSDCTDTEIKNVLHLRDVRRSSNQESITDMLAISQAKVLISSGSGFSRWGSYLGQVPRICYPGQRGVRVLSSLNPSHELEPECSDATDLPLEFINVVRTIFAKGS